MNEELLERIKKARLRQRPILETTIKDDIDVGFSDFAILLRNDIRRREKYKQSNWFKLEIIGRIIIGVFVIIFLLSILGFD